MIRVTLLQIFLTMQVHENEALVLFCIFQKKLRVEDLQVHRDTFHKIERRLTKVFIWITFILSCITLLYYMVFRYLIPISPGIYGVSMSIYMMGNFFFLLVIYNSSTLGLIYEMYKYHRMAFNEHVRSRLILFLANEFTMLIVVFGQMIFLFLSACYESEKDLDNTFEGVCVFVGT